MKTVENFIEKYLPVRIQSQISETLHYLYQGSDLKFLIETEKQIFDRMHQNILVDDGFGDLVRQMNQIHHDLKQLESSDSDDTISKVRFEDQRSIRESKDKTPKKKGH